MTQKEYKDKIEEYENKIQHLENMLAEKECIETKYHEVLENYYEIGSKLENERQYNINNSWVIEEQKKLIQKYEVIINRMTLGLGE